MQRPRLRAVAMIAVVAGLPVCLLRATEDEGNHASPAILEAISTPGPDFSARHPKVPPDLRLANASAAHAAGVAAIRSQPLKPKPSLAPRPALLVGLYVTYGALQALDAESTIRALRSGAAREGNPLLSPLATHPAALATFKLGLTAGTIYGIDRLFKSHHRLAMITLAAINGGYAYLVQRNYRNFPAR